MEVVCCDVYISLLSANGRTVPDGLLFFDVCGVLFNVLDISVYISIFRRGEQVVLDWKVTYTLL